MACTRRGNPLAYLAGIFVVTAVAWIGGWVTPPPTLVQPPGLLVGASSSSISLGALQLALLPAIITVMMTDLFDSLSTFIGVAQAANLLDARRPAAEPAPRPGRRRPRDAWRGTVRQFAGHGVRRERGRNSCRGRTGRTAIVTALCFVPCLFIAPLAAAVPAYATAAVLIIVGVVDVPDDHRRSTSIALEIAVPAFATLILIPLTFSITQGILWGFILHVALHVGRRPRAAISIARSSRSALVSVALC